MVFTSHIFIFYFLPLTLAVYHLLPDGTGPRNAWLLVASYIFYGWWNPWFTALMLAVTAVNHGCGIVIARPGAAESSRKAALTVAVSASLGLLVFFKYFGFLQTNWNHLLAAFGADGVRVWRIILPVGISFYVFQALSYTVDVYRRVAPPARTFADFACYIALFPQMIAGPIVRYGSIARALRERRHDASLFASGTVLFMLGFAKKVLLANPVGGAADAAFGAVSPDAPVAWAGVVAYALQIYFDFSGYSDMAVGLGRMFGFEFMKNFDAPYHAGSITDFWRRWHISLSTFLRDYLYIPLGGNRRGGGRTYANLAIVMLLGGLWHGANWTFVAWGAYHGLLLIAERAAGRAPAWRALPRPLRVAATFVLVLGSWVWFRAETLADAAAYFTAMVGCGVPADARAAMLAAQVFEPGRVVPMVVAGLLVLSRHQAHEWSATVTWPKALASLAVFVMALAAMFSQAFNPFLYFQF